MIVAWIVREIVELRREKYGLRWRTTVAALGKRSTIVWGVPVPGGGAALGSDPA
jgi:hypothetical protein